MSKATAGTLTAARGGTGRTDGRATALATARTISLTGDATGSVSFDGSANVSLPVNIKVGIMPSNSMSVYAGAGYPASPIITINA